jgi:tRNA A-37 threonylcarbamoyl transferase component Bud32
MDETVIGLICVGFVVLLVLGGLGAVIVLALGLRAKRPRPSEVPVLQETTPRPVPRTAMGGGGIAQFRKLQETTPRPVPRTVAPTTLRCQQCGANLAADGIEGLCPQCLLKGAISSVHDSARSADGEQTGAYTGSSAAPRVAELAALLPQLEILELIGQGGMGAVYKARQPTLDRLVAVKVLPPGAGRDPAFAERFNREARALARLSHPNIVAVHEIGHAGDHYYIVMEYVDGVNLRQLLRSGHLKPEQALRIIPQICDALQYAHEEGIVHRDVKPENILLDKKGRVKIADFGLAKLLGRDAENFTLTGSRQVVGTLNYMAPEQMERPLEVDHRADIYSLGVVFYEMLTGQLPLGRFPLPSEKAGTDARLDGIVLHAMEREPERRYQHASDVKSAVEANAYRPSEAADQSGGAAITVRARVDMPSQVLVVTGIVYIMLTVIAALVAVVSFFDMPSHRRESEVGSLLAVPLILLAVIVQGSLMMVGGLKMRHLEGYGWAVAASLVALAPASPLAVFGIPAGVWALAVLTAPDVKAAFAEQARRSLPPR